MGTLALPDPPAPKHDQLKPFLGSLSPFGRSLRLPTVSTAFLTTPAATLQKHFVRDLSYDCTLLAVSIVRPRCLLVLGVTLSIVTTTLDSVAISVANEATSSANRQTISNVIYTIYTEATAIKAQVSGDLGGGP